MKNEKTAFLNRVMNIHPAQIRGVLILFSGLVGYFEDVSRINLIPS